MVFAPAVPPLPRGRSEAGGGWVCLPLPFDALLTAEDEGGGVMACSSYSLERVRVERRRIGSAGAIALVLPFPPSANTLFESAPGGGCVATKRYREWREAAHGEIVRQRPRFAVGPVARAELEREDKRNMKTGEDVVFSGDASVSHPRLIGVSPNGTRYRILVNDAGTLSTAVA